MEKRGVVPVPVLKRKCLGDEKRKTEREVGDGTLIWAVGLVYIHRKLTAGQFSHTIVPWWRHQVTVLILISAVRLCH